MDEDVGRSDSRWLVVVYPVQRTTLVVQWPGRIDKIAGGIVQQTGGGREKEREIT